MSNKKGFTLIELLAVIIILSIVSTISYVIITTFVNRSKLKMLEQNKRLIEEAAYYYSVDNKLNDNDIFNKIEISKLKEAKMLKNSDIINPITKKEMNGCIVYKWSEEYNQYDFKYQGPCNIKNLKDIILLNYSYLETNGNGCILPNDKNYSYMGGCYLKGNPTNNFVWYSGYLWRIMGINADGTIRMITDENVTAIPWGPKGSAQNWEGSHAKDWLNTYFYPRLKGNNIIVEQQFCSEIITSDSSVRITCENNLSKEKLKVGLMTIDEYNHAGLTNSYLDIGQDQWTMTPYDGSYVWFVNCSGIVYNNFEVSDALGLRAVINVNSNTTITGGNGTSGKIWNQEIGPFVLNEDKNIEINGTLEDKITVGEYVELVGHKYRVVDKINQGVKLILDGYYEEPDGTVFEMAYGTNDVFNLESGIGQKLNDINLEKNVMKWLGLNEIIQKNKLLTEYKWYQAELHGGDKYDVAFKENNAIDGNVYVGLPTIGEILSSQSSSILTKGYTTISRWYNVPDYWAMNKIVPYAWYIRDGGYASYNSVSKTYALRPVIVVKSDNIITGGNGTWYNPYKI